MMKKNFVIVLLLATVLGAQAQKETAAERLHGLYRQATDLYQKQKYAAAQQIFDQIVSQSGSRADLGTADAAYHAAVCSEKLDNNDASFRLEEFLRLYPQSSRVNMARFYLGNFHYARADYEKALQYYRQVNPTEVEYNHRSEYNFKTGYCLLQRGDKDQAARYFAQQIDGQSKYRTGSLYYYAHLQYENGQYDLALRNFQELQQDKKFARIAPSYIARIYYYLGKDDELLALAPSLLQSSDVFRRDELHQMVGEIYFNRGEYSAALDQYRAVAHAAKAESCTPQDNDYQVGYSYYMLGHYDSAASYLQRKTSCNDSVAQNALYVLADCYLHLGRKMEARSMFLQASKMNFNPRIKEDALFNYAKLSCELNQNAMGESIKGFENYLKKYPRSVHRTEAEEILTELYCSTNNYKEAIRLLEQVPERSARLEQAYQRALINRGIELTNSGNATEGMKLYEKAVKLNAVPRMTADANYLLGEARYREGNMGEAQRNIERFMLSSFKNTSAYACDARYTYGYLQMRQKQYADAYATFDDLCQRLEGTADKHKAAMLCDARNRMGDCLYVQSRFAESIGMYDKVIQAKGRDADYATYQKALAYGAQGKNSEKLTYLNYIFERFDNSPLRPKAMLEIANTYMMCDNNEMAMTYYSNFIKQNPKSTYVRNALLNQGLIYYNTDRDQQALATFDRLLTEYPGSDEARDALGTIKNIYIAQNRVDEYFDYVQRTTKINISLMEQDSTTFLAAEELYQQADFDAASVALERYVNKFTNGLFVTKAYYLLGDCHMRQGNNALAYDRFVQVTRSGNSQYYEQSMLHAADMAFGMGRYAEAADCFEKLIEVATTDDNRLHGEQGSLRCAVAMRNHPSIVQAATRIADDAKAMPELKEEAWLACARSCFDNRQSDSAYALYGRLTHSANGEYSGEARCRQAEILLGKQAYPEAERMIEEIVKDASSDYWLAYSFILWADIYYARGNSLQAKQTLQSIVDNYDGADLVEVAMKKLEAIDSAEKPSQSNPGEEMTIEL